MMPSKKMFIEMTLTNDRKVSVNADHIKAVIAEYDHSIIAFEISCAKSDAEICVRESYEQIMFALADYDVLVVSANTKGIS